MWSDIETSEDLLGYSVHASLLKEIVSDEKNLPLTIGLYGDWGSGKSSILKILKEQLEKEDDVVVVYFDGWSFESFDDAKMALIQGIVDSLEKEEKFFAKVGDRASDTWTDLKDAFKRLRKSINWMRVMKITTKTIIPIAAASATGGASLIPLLLEAFGEHKEDIADILTGPDAERFLRDVLDAEHEDEKYMAVREFRDEFESLIKKSKQGKVVVLIDDLDRCLPRHIIDNLEAIKLFLNVPKTSFVIAADQYIVSNAIKSEYKQMIEVSGNEDRQNIGESYMEKFIQLPYVIPSLSPKEVETYVTLLFCQSFLSTQNFKKVHGDFVKFNETYKFDCYGWKQIQQVLSETESLELGQTIGFVSHFSQIIGKSLRWNPRLIKRFLNAYEVRSKLLSVSGIIDSKSRFALLKLMLIEQKYEAQFKQLNEWVMLGTNEQDKLLSLEKIVDSQERDFSEFKEWNTPDLITLISEEPRFSTVDIKELFWVSRDKIVDQMSGITLTSARVKSIFSELYSASTDTIRESVVVNKMKILSQEDYDDFFKLVDTKLLTDNADKNAYSVYYVCIKNDVQGAYMKLLDILRRIEVKRIPFSLSNKFVTILEKYNNDKQLLDILSANNKLMKAMNR